MIQQFTTWFQMLSQREKWILIVGSIAAVSILLWAFVIDPMQKDRVLLTQQIDQRKTELLWMQKGSRRIKQASLNNSTKPVVKKSHSLKVLVETNLTRFGLKEQLKQMTGNKQINLTLDHIQADSLMKFLGELEHRLLVNIQQLEIKPINDKGLINASLRLN